MKNLGEIYSHVLYMLGKDIMGAYLPPGKFQEVANAIQIELMNEFVRAFEVNRNLSYNLSPFTKTLGDDDFPPLEFNDFGKAEIPSDMVYPARSNYLKYLNTGCESTSEYKSIEFLNQADFDAVMNTPMLSPVTNPTEVGAKATIQNGKILVVPKLKKASLTYLRYPEKVVFDYDDVNGDVVYLPPNTSHADGTPSESREFEWGEDIYPELAKRIIQKAAINERSEFNLAQQQ